MTSKCTTGLPMVPPSVVTWCVGPGVRPRVAARSCCREPRNVVIPTMSVLLDGVLVGQVAVHEPYDGRVAVRRERDLDGAGAGWDAVVALPAPGEHHAAGWVDLDVLPHCDVTAVDVDAVAPAGRGLELGVVALPARHLVGVGEVGEDDVGRRLDPDLALDREATCHDVSPSSVGR